MWKNNQKIFSVLSEDVKTQLKRICKIWNVLVYSIHLWVCMMNLKNENIAFKDGNYGSIDIKLFFRIMTE